MITPNKFTDLDSSILAKLEIILDKAIADETIRDLYHAVAHRFETADEFLLALDVLYILGRVNVNFKTATVSDAA